MACKPLKITLKSASLNLTTNKEREKAIVYKDSVVVEMEEVNCVVVKERGEREVVVLETERLRF